MCVLGECMLEVSAEGLTGSQVPAGMSYGGDTLNTAVYFARMGGTVNYLTALGDDALSSWMIDRWQAEGVGCEWVRREPGGAPGLYLIQVDEQGERSFVYWRENSPARALLQSPTLLTKLLVDATANVELLYLSGITLALMNADSRSALFEFLKSYRSGGGSVAFDSNHRPALWSDAATAKTVYEQMYAHTDIALSTADDEYHLFGGTEPNSIVERLQLSGVQEIVVKDGNEGCLLLSAGDKVQVPALQVDVVDTTAAGDSFNAAYLASRSKGLDTLSAVQNGHALAGAVIGHRGAIVPGEAMPDTLQGNL